LALVLGLALAGRAAAVAPEIKDDGKFFSADAVKKANVAIRDIARKYGKDLLVETFAKVPDDQVEKVKAMSSEERAKFFGRWAAQRASDAVVNGVYVLVAKEPAHLRVVIAGKVGSLFTRRERDQLARQLRDDFHNKRFDEGLLAATKFVADRLAAGSKENRDNSDRIPD
jgi:hypothetical protein